MCLFSPQANVICIVYSVNNKKSIEKVSLSFFCAQCCPSDNHGSLSGVGEVDAGAGKNLLVLMRVALITFSLR